MFVEALLVDLLVRVPERNKLYLAQNGLYKERIEKLPIHSCKVFLGYGLSQSCVESVQSMGPT